jgi:hypothetical protein
MRFQLDITGRLQGVDTTKMPLGDIQQRTIDAGFEALHELEVLPLISMLM